MPVIDGLPGPVDGRQSAPGSAGAGAPDDPVDHRAVVNPAASSARAAGPVDQSGLALGLVAGDPGPHALAGEAYSRGDVRLSPAGSIPGDDQLAAVDGRAGITVGHREPPSGCGPSTSHTPLGGSPAFKPDPPSPTSWPGTASGAGSAGRRPGRLDQPVPQPLHGVGLEPGLPQGADHRPVPLVDGAEEVRHRPARHSCTSGGSRSMRSA